jgi:hypothetical protein
VHLLGVAPDSHTKSSRIDLGVKFCYHSNADYFFLSFDPNFVVKLFLFIVSSIINKWKSVFYRWIFLPLDQKLTVNPNLMRLAPNRREFESSPLLKSDLATPTLTFLSPPPFLPPKFLAISACALALIPHRRTPSGRQWQLLILISFRCLAQMKKKFTNLL